MPGYSAAPGNDANDTSRHRHPGAYPYSACSPRRHARNASRTTPYDVARQSIARNIGWQRRYRRCL